MTSRPDESSRASISAGKGRSAAEESARTESIYASIIAAPSSSPSLRSWMTAPPACCDLGYLRIVFLYASTALSLSTSFFWYIHPIAYAAGGA